MNIVVICESVKINEYFSLSVTKHNIYVCNRYNMILKQNLLLLNTQHKITFLKIALEEEWRGKKLNFKSYNTHALNYQEKKILNHSALPK